MRKRRINVTITGADQAWAVLRNSGPSEKEATKLFGVVIKDANPKRAHTALSNQMYNMTEHPDDVKEALVRIILDSGIDAPSYFYCIVELDPPSKFRAEAIRAYGKRSPRTAMHALNCAETFELSQSQRNTLIKRVLASKNEYAKAADAARILAFGFRATPQRRQLVKAAALPCYRCRVMEILQNERHYFRAEAPTDEERRLLIDGACEMVYGEQQKDREAAVLLQLPNVAPYLISEQKQKLKAVAKDVAEREARWAAGRSSKS